MAGTVADYLAARLALLPRGRLWGSLTQSRLFQDLMEALAEDDALLDERGDDLLAEAYPLTTAELLEDWEEFTGLPECTTLNTLGDRREAVAARIVGLSGYSKQFFIDMAAQMGFTITITEYFGLTVSGVMVAGDELAGNQDMVFQWQVDVDVVPDGFIAGEAVAGDELGSWDTKPLECLLEKLKPAHTELFFQYNTV